MGSAGGLAAPTWAAGQPLSCTIAGAAAGHIHQSGGNTTYINPVFSVIKLLETKKNHPQKIVVQTLLKVCFPGQAVRDSAPQFLNCCSDCGAVVRCGEGCLKVVCPALLRCCAQLQVSPRQIVCIIISNLRCGGSRFSSRRDFTFSLLTEFVCLCKILLNVGLFEVLI